jgi:outer membrane protein TolC
MLQAGRLMALGTVLLVAAGPDATYSPPAQQAAPSATVPESYSPGRGEATPHSPGPAPGSCTDPLGVLQGPVVTEGQLPPRLQPGQLQDTDLGLPINLATALRLADARPLVIAAAQASLRVSAAQFEQARVLWLPNVYVGASYYGHVGGGAGNSGELFSNTRENFLAGGGLTAVVATTDAIFAPLAARQVVRARTYDVQTARNDALESVAVAYFNVQQARGRLSGAEDAVVKSKELVNRVSGLTKDLAAPVEVNRARTQLDDLEQAVATAREQWRVASADLTRELRLAPGAVVVPLEMPYLQVTLVSPAELVDTLIPIGLTNRPELASQQALVQATLARLRQERLRPLFPSVVLLGDAVPAAPGGYLMGGVFGSDLNGHGNPWTGRFDPSVQVVWELRNLGLGNRALVRERRAETEQANIELFRIQDRVAAEVAQADAQMQSAATRIGRAEAGLKEAQINFAGNFRGISETSRFGDVLTLVIRPQEAVASLDQLARAYDNYFLAVNDYNRAQFRLFRAMGYPANLLSCERSPGPIQPVDTTRPIQMAPVCAPEPCQCPR